MAWNQSTHNKEQITSCHHTHMAHGLVGTNKTRLNVETISASVKQQYYDSMSASIKQRHMISKISKHGMRTKYSQYNSKHVIGESPEEAWITQ